MSLPQCWGEPRLSPFFIFSLCPSGSGNDRSRLTTFLASKLRKSAIPAQTATSGTVLTGCDPMLRERCILSTSWRRRLARSNRSKASMGKTSTGRAMCASIEMYVEDVDATYKPILHAAGAATSLPGGRTLGSGERTKDALGNGPVGCDIQNSTAQPTSLLPRPWAQPASGPRGSAVRKVMAKQRATRPFEILRLFSDSLV